MSVIVKARIDDSIKEEAAEILKQEGLTMSDAIRITLTRIVRNKTFAFVPNETTVAAINEARERSNLKRFDSIEALKADLYAND